MHQTSQVAAADRPDIIVITVDDLGAIDNRILERLPNISSLFLDQGLNFRDAYSETPLCCPGRASFLTGQHTRHHGVVVNDARLLDPSHTIATTLHDAGYFTTMVGKYLNGAAQLDDHTPPGWDEVAMLNDWSMNLSSKWWIQDQPATAGYFDRYIADQSAAWLYGAPENQPLFMWITPHAPHKSAASTLDWEPDVEPRYLGDPRCSGIEPWKPPSYDFAAEPNGFPLDDVCRSLLTVDDMIGQLRQITANQGRHPIWMLTSDNGMAWGEHGYLLKNVPYADKLPLYMSGPDIVSGKTQALVSNIDFAPTLADLAGTKMPTADGKSFAELLFGGEGGRQSMLEDHPVGGPTGEGDVATGPWWAVRTPDWHFIVWNGVHLYDTDADPWEMVDVAAEHPDVVDKLSQIYDRPMPSATTTPQPTPTASPAPGATPTPTDAESATPTPTQPPTTSSPLASASEPAPTLKSPDATPDQTAPAPGGVVTDPETPPSPAPGLGTAPLGAAPRTAGPSSVAILGFYALALAVAALIGVILGRRLRQRFPSAK
jgi:N-acetylglucosamine-6-sulfatase